MYIRWKVVSMWFLEGEENAMDGQIGYSFWFACGADFHEGISDQSHQTLQEYDSGIINIRRHPQNRDSGGSKLHLYFDFQKRFKFQNSG
ncbi:hypothetical protein Hdeb2414_s0010g00345301 [Helianthus debilis subsp. tardiflorus]